MLDSDPTFDQSPAQVSASLHPGVYLRSFYFQDPDGIILEFACRTKEFDAADIETVPRTDAERRPPVAANTSAATSSLSVELA